MTTPLYRIRNTLEKAYDDTIIVLNNWKMISDKFYLPIVWEERFIIERCSGIKDKNWVWIYEGDIIIDYDETHSDYNIPQKVIIDYQEWAKRRTEEISLWYRAWKRFEVIGNIHQ